MKGLTAFAIMWAANFAFFYFCDPIARTGIAKFMRAAGVSFALSLAAVITIMFGLIVAINVLGIEI